jgi:endonuclease YncB( thermonuclease family)
MKTNRFFWLLSGAPLILVPFSGGCSAVTANTPFLQAPTPMPTATLVPTPAPPFFNPAAGIPNPPLPHLNAPGDPVKPDAFRIASAITGDTVALQSVDTVKVGNPARDVVSVGPADTVKLAGIVAPTTDPGLQGARSAISGWTVGQDLDVDQDPKFPVDASGTRLMQVYFKGRKLPDLPPGAKAPPSRRSYEGVTLSLNRMLVRSGWAVVDLYSPTSFDTSQWLLDEAYARKNRLGFWKFGQVVQQRVPVKTAPGTRTRRGSLSVVTIRPTDRPGRLGTNAPGALQPGVGGATQTTTTQTTTTQTTTQIGAPGAPGPAQPPASAMQPPASAAPGEPTR